MAPFLIDPLHKRLELDRFLEEQASRGWQWSMCDCTISIADWIMLVTGRDPAKPWRGTYFTAEQARDLAKRNGGFVPWIGKLLDDVGLERTQAPETGDVGIIIAPRAFAQTMPVVGAVMAIRRDELWIAKAMRGIVGYPFEALTAWRL